MSGDWRGQVYRITRELFDRVLAMCPQDLVDEVAKKVPPAPAVPLRRCLWPSAL